MRICSEINCGSCGTMQMSPGRTPIKKKKYTYPSPTISSSTQGSESLLTARGGGLAIFMYCKRYSDKAGPRGTTEVVLVGGPSDLLRREGRVWGPPRSSDCNMNRKAIPSLKVGSGSSGEDINLTTIQCSHTF